MNTASAKFRSTRGTPVVSGVSTRVSYIAIRTGTIPTAVRWSFLLFVFTLPFEATDLGFMTGSLSIAKLCGFLFFLLYGLYYGPFSKRRSFPPLSKAACWFLAYIVLFAAHLPFVPADLDGEFLSFLFTLVQLLFLFWLASDLLREMKIARHVLLTYAIASSIMAFLTTLDLPGFSTNLGAGRVTTLGENANTLGQHFVLAVLILIGLTLSSSFSRFTTKILLLLLIMPLLGGIVSTGSRGAVVALAIGCLIYLIPHWRSRRTLISVILVTFAIGSAAYKINTDPDFLERWREYYYEGDTSGRGVIYAAATKMISERPIFGWHPVFSFYELGRRVGLWEGRDTHNLFLHLLIAVGVIGTLPFLCGLYLCAQAAWKARAGPWGQMPAAVLFGILAANMSLTLVTWKPQWLFFALTIAAASSGVSGARKQSILRLRPQPQNDHMGAA